jgi:hypothetical protein
MKEGEQITRIKCSLRCGEISEAAYVAGNTEAGFNVPIFILLRTVELFTWYKNILKSRGI